MFHGGETGETAEAGQLGLLVIDHLAQLVDPGLEGVDLSLAVLEHDLRVLGPRRWRAPRPLSPTLAMVDSSAP